MCLSGLNPLSSFKISIEYIIKNPNSRGLALNGYENFLRSSTGPMNEMEKIINILKLFVKQIRIKYINPS